MNTQFAFDRKRVNVTLDELPASINGKMVHDSVMDEKYILNHVISFALPITDDAIDYYKDAYYILHPEFGLMEIFKIEIPSKNDEIVYVIVTPQIMTAADIPNDILRDFARLNIYHKMSFKNIFRVLDSILGPGDSPADEPPIYVATTNKNIGGGAILFSETALNEIYHNLNCQNYLIIPSSIHELLVTPLGSNDHISDFKAMVQMVNDSNVDPHERLSYNVFKYSEEKGKCHLEKY